MSFDQIKLENALNFMCCVFLYDVLKDRIIKLPTGDAEGLLKLAQQMGYQVTPDDLLVALELTVREMLGEKAPSADEIAALLKDAQFMETLRHRQEDLLTVLLRPQPPLKRLN